MINADNGPENSGSRTQWLKRLVEFAALHQVDAQLAFYPPYHSKYNPTLAGLWGIRKLLEWRSIDQCGQGAGHG